MKVTRRSKDIRYYLFALFLSLNLSSHDSIGQSRLQQFDEQALINISQQRTPKKTGVLFFISKKHLYGELGVPAALFLGGVATSDRHMRQKCFICSQ